MVVRRGSLAIVGDKYSEEYLKNKRETGLTSRTLCSIFLKQFSLHDCDSGDTGQSPFSVPVLFLPMFLAIAP